MADEARGGGVKSDVCVGAICVGARGTGLVGMLRAEQHQAVDFQKRHVHMAAHADDENSATIIRKAREKGLAHLLSLAQRMRTKACQC